MAVTPGDADERWAEAGDQARPNARETAGESQDGRVASTQRDNVRADALSKDSASGRSRQCQAQAEQIQRRAAARAVSQHLRYMSAVRSTR